ncbi:hypothetical protein ACFVRD_44710 [Streptomyces sp. NPDC057908]|uniref:hypothetical protein n=1 Tax=Streptomyces sp. NPDC057908 TaxID=3346276 RepID=UPI0036E56D11
MMKSLVASMAVVTLTFGAFTLGSTAHAAEAPVAAVACAVGGPHTDFKGTDIRMRNKPGGDEVGWANQGDCAYLIQSDPGPRIDCPDGSNTIAWHLVRNERTGVVGYVSACFL